MTQTRESNEDDLGKREDGSGEARLVVIIAPINSSPSSHKLQTLVAKDRANALLVFCDYLFGI
jgi:hypothetical protein